MEGGETHEPPRSCFEVDVSRGGWKPAVLWLNHGATQQRAVEATVDLNCKTVSFNQLFGDVNILSIVSSKKVHFLNVTLFLLNSLRSVVLSLLL